MNLQLRKLLYESKNLTESDKGFFMKLDDAISTLYIHSYINRVAMDSARKKLFKEVKTKEGKQ